MAIIRFWFLGVGGGGVFTEVAEVDGEIMMMMMMMVRRVEKMVGTAITNFGED